MQHPFKLRLTQGIIAILLTLVVGCADEERNRNLVNEPAAELALSLSKQSSDVEFQPLTVPSGKHPLIERFRSKRLEDLTDQEQKEIRGFMEQFQEADRRLNPTKVRIMRAILKSKSWQETDRKVREELGSIAQDPYAFVLEQTSAHRMLSEHLLRGEEVSEKKEAVAYYTELLLRNEYPDAEVLSNALEALEGTWSPSQLARAATQTAKHTRDYLRQNPCEPCIEKSGMGPADKAGRLLDARQRKLYRMQNSLSKLDKLGKRES